jgi:hypothetical protein
MRKSPRHPLERKVGGPQTRSGKRGEEKILPVPGLELQFKCDSEQNTFRNLTHASEVNLWKYAQFVQHSAENRKGELSDPPPPPPKWGASDTTALRRRNVGIKMNDFVILCDSELIGGGEKTYIIFWAGRWTVISSPRCDLLPPISHLDRTSRVVEWIASVSQGDIRYTRTLQLMFSPVFAIAS